MVGGLIIEVTEAAAAVCFHLCLRSPRSARGIFRHLLRLQGVLIWQNPNLVYLQRAAVSAFPDTSPKFCSKTLWRLFRVKSGISLKSRVTSAALLPARSAHHCPVGHRHKNIIARARGRPPSSQQFGERSARTTRGSPLRSPFGGWAHFRGEIFPLPKCINRISSSTGQGVEYISCPHWDREVGVSRKKIYKYTEETVTRAVGGKILKCCGCHR